MYYCLTVSKCVYEMQAPRYFQFIFYKLPQTRNNNKNHVIYVFSVWVVQWPRPKSGERPQFFLVFAEYWHLDSTSVRCWLTTQRVINCGIVVVIFNKQEFYCFVRGCETKHYLLQNVLFCTQKLETKHFVIMRL